MLLAMSAAVILIGPYHFLLSRNRAPASVQAKDILEFNLEGSPLWQLPASLS